MKRTTFESIPVIHHNVGGYPRTHHMIQSLLATSRKVSTVGSRLFTNTTARRYSSNDKGSENVEKPDLRSAGRDNKAAKLIGAACVLVVIYMYPMIFKPLFSIGSSENEDQTSKNIEKFKSKLAEHRPSNMPEWTSPFGPKGGSK